ncbi:hypothetical protein PFISCL1PPCAC_1640, partial [Pristionchus fissidentatus]
IPFCSMNSSPVLIDLTNENEQPLKKRKLDEQQKLVKYPIQVKITPDTSASIPKGSDGVLITSYCTRNPTSNLFITPSSASATLAPTTSDSANTAPVQYHRISATPGGSIPTANEPECTHLTPNGASNVQVGATVISWSTGALNIPVPDGKIEGEIVETTDATFCDVTSHIKLTRGNNVKISVSEIQRRLGAPEYQDKEMIARLTRFPKSQRSTFDLSFTKFNFDGQVRSGMERKETTIDSLLESDAVQLAKDFTKVTSYELSLSVLSPIVADSMRNRFPEFKRCFNQINAHLSRVKQHILCAGREPSEMMRHMECLQIPEAHSVWGFSLATHGFGPLAVAGVFECLMQIINHMDRGDVKEEEIESVKAILPHLRKSDGSVNVSDFNHGLPSNSSIDQTKNAFCQSSQIDLSLLTPLPSGVVVLFDSVPPRIGCNTRQIEVSLGEIRRRVLGPEKFNLAFLGYYTRRKITPITPRFIYGILEENGLNTTHRPKMALEPSSWTSLTEKEAMNVAEESVLHLSIVTLPVGLKRSKKDDAAMWIVQMANALSVAMRRIGASPSQPQVNTNADLHILRYAMITHHFGHSFFASVMEWIMKVM